MDQYLGVFLDESREHLQGMNDGLLTLEKQPNDITVVQEIFRAAHTLKGMSATMGFQDMAELTHQLENVLDAVRNGQIVAESNVVDVLFQSADVLEAIVGGIAEGGDGRYHVKPIISGLNNLINDESAATTTEYEEVEQSIEFNEYEKAVLSQSRELGFTAYRIRISLREDCLLKAARVFMVFEVLEGAGEVIQSVPPVDKLEEEAFEQEFSVVLISEKNQDAIKEQILKVSEIESVNVEKLDGSLPKAVGRSPQPNDTQSDKTPPQMQKTKPAAKTIRINTERLDRLMNLFEEWVIDKGRLEKISREAGNADLWETVERMSRVSGDMQDIILNLRMMPIDQVFGRFPKMVRGLAKDLNKSVQLNITGADTELDRTVIDEIGDPLVHLLRNSLDHGIETPEVRESNGKAREGTVDLKAFYSGNHVLIEIKDDGAGINREAVLKKALENRVITETEAGRLSDREVYELLFSSGFSTAEVISDISGRGVGLDVVKNKIESLGGQVEVDSLPGTGTTFTVQLPLTLSIIAAMLVKIGLETYAVPLSSIVEIAVIREIDIITAHKQQLMDFREKMIPLIFMKEVFDVEHEATKCSSYSVVVIQKGDKLAGLVVDEFIGHQEVVLKSLGNYLKDIFGISGATVLADGQVALMIDCNPLIN